MKVNDRSDEIDLDRLRKEEKWKKESDRSEEVEIDRLVQEKVDESQRSIIRN
jgi:hypothetical protein